MDELKQISATLFGSTAELEIVEPTSLQLLKTNAHYFKKEKFTQLVENVRNDQRLSSMPLCHRVEKGLEVLSGNHRVKAAIEAKIPKILVMVLTESLSESRKVAIQLSHNELVGEDDESILAELWQKIDGIKEQLYTGLSSDKLKDLEKIKLVTFTTPAIGVKTVSFNFAVPDFEHLEEVTEQISAKPAHSKYVADMEDFTEFVAAIRKIKNSENIKNGALAVKFIIDLVASQYGQEEECHSSEA